MRRSLRAHQDPYPSVRASGATLVRLSGSQFHCPSHLRWQAIHHVECGSSPALADENSLSPGQPRVASMSVRPTTELQTDASIISSAAEHMRLQISWIN